MKTDKKKVKETFLRKKEFMKGKFLSTRLFEFLRIANSFCSIENSFKFFVSVRIYDMKTDNEKLKETFLRKKEFKKLKICKPSLVSHFSRENSYEKDHNTYPD